MSNKVKYILFFSLIALLYLYVGSGSCERSDDLQPQVAKIEQKKKESESIKSQISKADTAQKKAVKRWDEVKRIAKAKKIDTSSVASHRCDTIIQTLIISCDSALAAKDSLSVQKDKLIANLQEENQLHENLENALQTENTVLKKQVKKERRKRKLISTLGVAISAFLVGIAVTR